VGRVRKVGEGSCRIDVLTIRLAGSAKLVGMLVAIASALPLASAKLILLPLGIFAFVLFLLLLGAVALGLSMTLLGAISWVVRIPRRRFERKTDRFSGGAR
jgi:ABC-type siderophore export system fused ATPase/permease subunit